MASKRHRLICDGARQTRIGSLGRVSSDVVCVAGVPVGLTTTPCGFGGSRPWFLCPGCDRRCGVLYHRPAGPRCRLCVRGRYRSELASPSGRRLLRAFRIRDRLGQTEGGIVAPFPDKPKGMRWHSYLRLRRDAEAREAQAWRDAARQFSTG